jgi:aquaglyceroporin related protein
MASIGRAPTNRTTRENVNEEPNRRPEKKQRQTVDVDNDYFALNPWYNEQKSKPVFGLGAPLPHTVRHGMWWGRGDLRKSLYKVDEDQEGEAVDFKDGQGKLPHCKTSVMHGRPLMCSILGLEEDSEGSQVPLRSQGSNQRRDPDHFQTTIEGRPVNMKRVQTSEANQFLDNQDQPHESREHDQRGRAPVNEHGLEFSGQHGEQHQFGLQDGLPPLQKLDTSESTQSQKEENEIERREQEAEKEFYDQYRNPIARLRARYPQAPAEFVAVSTAFDLKKILLTYPRLLSTS